MSTADLAMALERVESVLLRRPTSGLSHDAAATVRWTGGTRILARHPEGHEVITDVAPELGGAGGAVSPGWMLRAGVGACAATCIAMLAAREGIVLSELEVEVGSRSDTRGMLGLRDADGAAVDPGPQDTFLKVRIAAPGVAAARLRAMVEVACERAPMSAALTQPRPIALQIEAADG